MQNYSGDPGEVENTPGQSWINIGCGSDLTMKELGKKIADIVMLHVTQSSVDMAYFM